MFNTHLLYLESKTTPYFGCIKASKKFCSIYYVASIHSGIVGFQVFRSTELKKVKIDDQIRRKGDTAVVVCFIFPMGSSLTAFRSLLVQEIKL